MKPAIEELKKELTEKHNLYLRALADYQNLEKRMLQAKDKEIKNFLFGFSFLVLFFLLFLLLSTVS